ncbi:heavy-metal-associated domain-containing protein [Sungkyunkwania multivorans]|uniref:Heavy-metal-associated domain-containing protein n=1 Tax=Sungkyunkwania multivorans TaxID=1173618 RepID=A0ABW3D373_9FLAO
MMFKKVAVLVFGTILFTACKNDSNTPEVKTVATPTEIAKVEISPENLAKAEFKIDGMTCAIGCAATIQKNLAKMEGVESAKVDFDKKLAMVSYDKTTVGFDDLAMTVTKTAEIYKVSDMKSVDEFGKDNGEKKECPADCKKECCKDKTKSDKKECAADCKKACCAKKA